MIYIDPSLWLVYIWYRTINQVFSPGFHTSSLFTRCWGKKQSNHTWNNTSGYQESPKSSAVHAQTPVASFSLWLNSQRALCFVRVLRARQQVLLQVPLDRGGGGSKSSQVSMYAPSSRASNIVVRVNSRPSLVLSSLCEADFPPEAAAAAAAAASVWLKLGGDKAV